MAHAQSNLSEHPRVAVPAAALDALIRPRSIAVAGASADPGKLGSLPLQFLRKFGYRGELYPINPNADTIHGVRCRASLRDVEAEVDLLVVAVAAARIPALLEECRPGQVKSALILSSGYAETGEAGRALQQELGELAAVKGVRFIGPNSVGVVNLHEGVVASISQVFDQQALTPGPVAFVSQSGAVGTAITALAHREGVGIGYFLSTGNEADLEFSDFCDYFVDDPKVRVIAGYLESIRDGAKFRRAASRAIRAGKPIVLVKVGTTEVGSNAVRSHTGALAGAEEVYRAVFEEAGVVRANGIEELTDLLKMFAAFPRPARGGRARAAVLSHSGGAGVLIADTAVNLGLEVPPPSPALASALKKRLPPFASLANPIDMTASVIFSPEVMAATVYDAARSGEYDAVMLCVNLIWRQGDALADQLISGRSDLDCTLAVAWIAGPEGPIQHLGREGIPVFSDPVRCARAVAAKARWDRAYLEVLARRPMAIELGAATPAAELRTFAGQQALLQGYGISLAAGALVADADKARARARDLGYPVAAKLMAPTLLHKSEAGAVITGIANEAALGAALRHLLAIPQGDREGVLVQKMVSDPAQVELFAGVMRDPVFGPVVVFGLGGVFVEILREVQMRPAPFTPEEALAMIRSARFFPMLDGARGRARCDVAGLAGLLSRLSELAVRETGVTSVDLNPIMVSPAGAVVVDFKFVPAA